MTGEIRNPAQLPRDLNQAEEKFVHCLAAGRPCIIGDGKLPIKGIKSGEGANVVRSEVIRFVALGGSNDHPVWDSAIYLQGAWICGEEPSLDLTHADIRYPLGFFHCYFADRVEMMNAKCPALYMFGSRLAKGLQAGGMRTDGPVHLRKGFVADQNVDLSRAHIGGDLDCTGGTFNDSNGRAFIASQATVKGAIFMHDGFSAEGEVRLLSARIDGDFDCRGGRFNNLEGNALSADGMAVEGNVFLNKGFVAKGHVNLLHARVGGDLDCTGGEFNNSKGPALNACGMTVRSNVFLCEKFIANGCVQILHARIGGLLDCSNGQFNKPIRQAGFIANIFALDAAEMKVGHHVKLSDACISGVSISGSQIGGHLSCPAAKIYNPKSVALDAHRAKIDGDVYLTRGFFARGEVRLVDADIKGNLDCGGGRFINRKGNALNAGGVKTTGHVYLNKLPEGEKFPPFLAVGKVRLATAIIGRNLNCKGGRFLNRGNRAISASGVKAGGAIFLSDNFYANGEVRLHVARMGGNLVYTKCDQRKAGSPERSVLNLASAKAAAVEDDEASWEVFKFRLDGFSYNLFFGDSPKDKSRCKWLDKRDGDFSPLPYEQAAKVFFAMGRPSVARETLRTKEQKSTKHDKWNWWQKLLRLIWEHGTGYGYRPARTFVCGLLFVLFGAIFFCIADNYNNIVPNHPVVMVNKDYKEAIPNTESPTRALQGAVPEYPAFNPLVFSLDVFTPSAVFHQEASWGPRSGSAANWRALTELVVVIAIPALYFWFFWFILIGCLHLPSALEKYRISLWRWGGGAIAVVAMFMFVGAKSFDILWLLTFWYWLEILMGWVLIPLFLLSVTGLLRPRQSSGERD